MNEETKDILRELSQHVANAELFALRAREADDELFRDVYHRSSLKSWTMALHCAAKVLNHEGELSGG